MNPLLHFQALPADEQDVTMWFALRGNLLPAPFRPEPGRLYRLPGADGRVSYFKAH